MPGNDPAQCRCGEATMRGYKPPPVVFDEEVYRDHGISGLFAEELGTHECLLATKYVNLTGVSALYLAAGTVG